jgi:hypothetical protein
MRDIRQKVIHEGQEFAGISLYLRCSGLQYGLVGQVSCLLFQLWVGADQRSCDRQGHSYRRIRAPWEEARRPTIGGFSSAQGGSVYLVGVRFSRRRRSDQTTRTRRYDRKRVPSNPCGYPDLSQFGRILHFHSSICIPGIAASFGRGQLSIPVLPNRNDVQIKRRLRRRDSLCGV